MVDRRTYLKTLGATTVIGLAGCQGGDDGGDGGATDDGGPVTWILGTSSEGTASFATGQGFQTVMREHSDRVNLEAQISSGQQANMQRLGEAFDVAMIEPLIVEMARNRVGPFEQNAPPDPGSLAFTWSGAECWIATHADNDEIQTYDDLAGKTIATWSSGSALKTVCDRVFDTIGILDGYERRDIPNTEYGAAMANGRIEACGMYTLGGGAALSSSLEQLVARNTLKPLQFTEAHLADLDGNETIKTRTFSPEPAPNIDEVTAWLSNTNVTFRSDLPEDLVEHTVRTLIENWDQVREAFGGVFPAEESMMTRGLSPALPIHAGAANYLEERGWWDEDYQRG